MWLRSAPTSAEMKATARAAIPLLISSSRAALHLLRRLAKQAILGLQAAADARGGAARWLDQAREDQLARRLGCGQRLGQRPKLGEP